MKKIIIKNKLREIALLTENENLINPQAEGMGLPARVVLASSEYDLADVIESYPEVSETLVRKIVFPETTQEIIHEDILNELGEIVTPSWIETIVTPGYEVDEEYTHIITPAMVKLCAEYTIETFDITAEIEQAKVNAEALKFLADSDWIVIRHRDQIAANIPTSLDYAEYEKVLHDRQQARSTVVR